MREAIEWVLTQYPQLGDKQATDLVEGVLARSPKEGLEREVERPETRTLYNITAAELHASVFADLIAYLQHYGVDTARLGTGDEHPLEQTIRLACELRLNAEVDRLEKELAKADDHPLVMQEGGTSGIDRCHRLINRLSAADWYWDEADREYAHQNIKECLEAYEVGEIAELRPLHELPTIWVLAKRDGYSVHDSKRAAEAAREKDR